MIVTARARWIVVLALGAAALGVLRQQAPVVCFALACLSWLGIEWFVFRCYLELVVGRIVTRRDIKDRHGDVRVLWEGRPYDVVVRMELPKWRWLAVVLIHAQELVTPTVKDDDGPSELSLITGSTPRWQLHYRVRARSAGALKFVGVRLLCKDLHGFFQAERFLECAQTYKVLPWTRDAGTLVSTQKKHNALSPPGIHRIARAGSGSELLEIRDYVTGDSPRSIAWKVSAKRGVLMCKQFESEVPVRCHLIVDLSRSVRWGYPGSNAGSRLVTLAATIADALAANRDPVGLAIVDGDDVSIEKPSASRHAVLRIIDMLATAVDKPMIPVAAPAAWLLPLALDFARIRDPQGFEQARRGVRGFFPITRTRRQRLQMAFFLSGYYRLEPSALAAMGELDEELSAWLQRFLGEHQVPYAGTRFDLQGRDLFDDGAKVARIGKLIQRAVRHGRDNELFVIMAELCDGEYDLNPLLQAITVARARHHRVMLIAAWAPDLPLPGAPNGSPWDRLVKDAAIAADVAWGRRQAAYQRLRRELGRLHVPVVPALHDQADRLILNQLELVRAGRVAS